MKANETSELEVRCLGLTLILSFVKKRGISTGDLLKGLDYDEEYLLKTSNWIDRETFFEVENRVRKLFPDEKNLFYEIGLQASKTKSFGFLRLLANLSGTPFGIYRLIEKLIAKHMFRFILVQIVQKKENEAVLKYTFEGPIKIYSSFMETVRGILAAVPELAGFNKADVSYTISGNENAAYFTVRYPTRANVFKRFWRYLFVRGSVLPETYREIESAHETLLQKMNELEEAHENLKRNVTKLESLNELETLLGSKIEINLLVESFLQFMGEKFSISRILVILSKKDEKRAGGTCFSKGFYNGDEGKYYTLDYVCDVEGISALTEGEGARSCRLGGADIEHLTASDAIYRHVFGREKCILLYPLTWSGTVMGYTLFGFRTGEGVGLEEERFFRGVTDIFAIYLHNALTYSELDLLNRSLGRQVEEKTRAMKTINEALRRELEEKDRFDRMKKDFVMYVGHALKTPVAMMQQWLRETRRRADRLNDEELAGDLTRLEQFTGRLMTMATRLHDYARLESGKFDYEFRDIDMGMLLEESMSDCMVLAAAKDITVDYDRFDDKCVVHGNKELLGSALSNIVENAVKYTPKGGRVRVSGLVDGGGCRICVEDNGSGIPQEEIHAIFEPYYRGKNIKTDAAGWGIGLPLARVIITRHGGSVEVKSEAGKGTCFTVHLPVSGAAEPTSVESSEIISLSDSSISGEPPRPSPGPRNSLSEEKLYSLLVDFPPMKYTILVAEDDEFFLELLRARLSRVFNVVPVRNGAQVFKELETSRPDLILSDVMMKPIDGLTMCEMLKNDVKYASIPVILMTAMEGTDGTIQGFLRGANDYLKKPFSMDELFVRVRLQLRLVEAGRKMIVSEKIASLGMLMAGVAHEVRNPVNAIINSVPPIGRALDRVDRRGSGEDGRREIDDIKLLLGVVSSSSERILDLIQGIQRYVSAPDFESRELKVEEIIDTVLSILNHKMRGRIRVEKSYGFDGRLRGSPGRLSQVFLNIIDNAISSIKDEGVISIRTAADGDHVVVCVRDSGQGIPDGIRSRIFDPFFTTKEIGVGTGLGLSICKEIIEAHHGRIDVESASGKGTEFRIFLPLAGAAS